MRASIFLPRKRTLSIGAIALFFASIVSGCDSSRPRQKVYPVKGRILARGQPASHAKVFLVPLGVDDVDTLRPRATTAQDGTFTVSTYEPGDGAPAGDYAVGIAWRGPQKSGAAEEPPPPEKDYGKEEGRIDFFKGRYKDPRTSGLKIKVKAEPTTLDDIDLK